MLLAARLLSVLLLLAISSDVSSLPLRRGSFLSSTKMHNSTFAVAATTQKQPDVDVVSMNGHSSDVLQGARAYYDPLTATPVDTMNSVEQTWEHLEELGEMLTRFSKSSLLLRAMAAGIFVGYGGILTSSVGFDMGHLPWLPGNGWYRFMTGAIGFPLSILLISMTGTGAWTGDMLLVMKAFFGQFLTSDTTISTKKGAKKAKVGRITVKALVRFSTLTWFGCLIGTCLMGAVATIANLPCIEPCIAITLHKLELTFLQIFARGVLGGALICLAIFMSKVNRDMIGKVIGIWFPISTYVMCDYEHVLASMFFMSVAKLNSNRPDITLNHILKFLIPSTLGNLVGGGLFVGVLLSSVPRKIRPSIEAR